jgi:hypothetical protein
MNLIPKDYSRCSNETCVKKTICKRFLQLEIDLKEGKNNPISVCRFKSKDCEKIIRV